MATQYRKERTLKGLFSDASDYDTNKWSLIDEDYSDVDLNNVRVGMWVDEENTTRDDPDTVESDAVMVDASWLRLNKCTRAIDYVSAPYHDTVTRDNHIGNDANPRMYRFEQKGADYPLAVSVSVVRELANDVFHCDYATLKNNAYAVPKDIEESINHSSPQLMVLFSLPGEPVDVLVESIQYSPHQIS